MSVTDVFLLQDSLFFVQKFNEPTLPTGDFLGDLTNSLKPGEFIKVFTSLGPKSYSYILNTGEQKTVVKGFSVSRQTKRSLNHASLKRLLFDSLNPGDIPQVIKIDYDFNIRRNKRKMDVFSIPMAKRFKMTYSKRRIIEGFNTLPFGFCSK
jgi:hypothetical protein